MESQRGNTSSCERPEKWQVDRRQQTPQGACKATSLHGSPSGLSTGYRKPAPHSRGMERQMDLFLGNHLPRPLRQSLRSLSLLVRRSVVLGQIGRGGGWERGGKSGG